MQSTTSLLSQNSHGEKTKNSQIKTSSSDRVVEGAKTLALSLISMPAVANGEIPNSGVSHYWILIGSLLAAGGITIFVKKKNKEKKEEELRKAKEEYEKGKQLRDLGEKLIIPKDPIDGTNDWKKVWDKIYEPGSSKTKVQSTLPGFTIGFRDKKMTGDFFMSTHGLGRQHALYLRMEEDNQSFMYEICLGKHPLGELFFRTPRAYFTFMNSLCLWDRDGDMMDGRRGRHVTGTIYILYSPAKDTKNALTLDEVQKFGLYNYGDYGNGAPYNLPQILQDNKK